MANKQNAPIAMVIGADPKKRIVIFQFSGPIDRVEYTPAQARGVAESLISRAAIAEGSAPEDPKPKVENVHANKDLSDEQKRRAMRSTESAMRIRDLKAGETLTEQQMAAIEFLLAPILEIVRKIPIRKLEPGKDFTVTDSDGRDMTEELTK